jgi:hypothetical protein
MRFPQLPVGQRFLYQGETYVKTGPVSARRERDGEGRMIPRSALVSLPGAESPAPAGGPDALSDPIERALGAYESALRDALAPPGMTPGETDFSARLDSALAVARSAFRKSLSRGGQG